MIHCISLRARLKLTIRLSLFVLFLSLSSQANSFTLWSDDSLPNGPGKLYGPGAYIADQILFDMTLRNLSFTTNSNFLMPFYNNGAEAPNICSELELLDDSNGKLSNGYVINENADMCSATIAGTDMLVAVIAEGEHQGQQLFVRQENGEITVSMDLALDLNIGEKGIIRLPFVGTTGSATVPLSLQTQNSLSQGDNPKSGVQGLDQAGIYESGTVLTGKVGDFNNDGWIDGTLVSVGNIPLNSPVFPGQPFAMHRHFELNVPVEGFTFGNVKALVATKEK